MILSALLKCQLKRSVRGTVCFFFPKLAHSLKSSDHYCPFLQMCQPTPAPELRTTNVGKNVFKSLRHVPQGKIRHISSYPLTVGVLTVYEAAFRDTF